MVSISLNARAYSYEKGHSGEAGVVASVKEGMFGGIVVNNSQENFSAFTAATGDMHLTNIRWSGGSLAETGSYLTTDNDRMRVSTSGGDQQSWMNGPTAAWNYVYDLAYDNLVAPELLSDNKPLSSLSDVLKLARDAGTSFEMILPTLRYIDQQITLSDPAQQQLLDRAHSDAARLLDRIFVEGSFGKLPKEVIFDIGNENLVWSTLDPNKTYAHGVKYDAEYTQTQIENYIAVSREYLSAAKDFRDAHPGIEFKVAIQIPYMNDKAGTDDPASVFQKLLGQLPDALLGQIDQIRAHSLQKGLEGGANLERWFANEVVDPVKLIDASRAAIGREGKTDINFSAWTSNGESNADPEGKPFSLEAAAATVAHFASLVEIGADYASAWGIGIDYSGSVQASRYDDKFDRMVYTPRGEVLRQMSESLVGTKLLANRDYIDAGRDGPVNMQAFADKSKVVLFISANDIADGGEKVTLDLKNFRGQIGYAWAESIVASGAHNAARGEAAVWNPMSGLNAANAGGVVDLSFDRDSLSFTLNSDYQMVRLILAKSNPGDGALHLVGDSRAAAGQVNDRLLGGEVADKLYGLTGDDKIGGGGGNDLIDGGAGRDLLRGGGGDDTMKGGSGDDRMYSGSGRNVLDGGHGHDFIVGGTGADRLNGGVGNDKVAGAGGHDRIVGGAGHDSLWGGAGNDTMAGGSGDDRLYGGSGRNVLDGGDGNDLVVGGAGADRLNGGAGNDRIDGGAHNDRIDAGAGNDVVNGGAGRDQVWLGSGNDRFLSPVMDGGDIVLGMAGNDTIDGGGGSDRMDGGPGDDVLIGGTGADTFIFRAGMGSDRISDFAVGNDRLVLDDVLWGGGQTVRELINNFAHTVNGDTVLDFGNGNMVILDGIDSARVIIDDIFIV